MKGNNEKNDKKNINMKIETHLTRAALLNLTDSGLCWMG